MAVSISDVARKARVSISTVSRVVNRPDVVNDETRARVQSAIRELGYRPNAFARGLMLRRSDILGLVLPDLHGEFYSEIIRGADREAREWGYNLVISSTRDGDDSHSMLHAIQQRTLLDGVAVMVSELTPAVGEALRDFQLPFVVLDDDIDCRPHDCVVIDQRHGATALMEHVVSRCAARRVIFVGGPESNMDTMARLAACGAVLARAGTPLRQQDVHFLDYEYESAFRLATAQLANWLGPRTCVFAANDEMAAGVAAAVSAAGRSVPADLAVVGFDDTRIARMTRPPLTTVRVPMSTMGAEAIRLLCQRLDEPNRPVERISLNPQLVVRESCGSRRE